MNIVDIVAVIPFFVDMFPTPVMVDSIRVFRLIRVSRVVKMARHSQNLRIMLITMRDSLEDLYFLLILLMFSTVIWSTGSTNLQKKE